MLPSIYASPNALGQGKPSKKAWVPDMNLKVHFVHHTSGTGTHETTSACNSLQAYCICSIQSLIWLASKQRNESCSTPCFKKLPDLALRICLPAAGRRASWLHWSCSKNIQKAGGTRILCSTTWHLITLSCMVKVWDVQNGSAMMFWKEVDVKTGCTKRSMPAALVMVCTNLAYQWLRSIDQEARQQALGKQLW